MDVEYSKEPDNTYLSGDSLFSRSEGTFTLLIDGSPVFRCIFDQTDESHPMYDNTTRHIRLDSFSISILKLGDWVDEISEVVSCAKIFVEKKGKEWKEHVAQCEIDSIDLDLGKFEDETEDKE